MSSQRFSLLPAHYAERVAERRWVRISGAALAVLLGLLVVVGLSQSRQLRKTEGKRSLEQARNAALVARGGQLVRFRQLADAVAGRERLLAAAMGTEVSWASLLNSLASTFPADSSLTSITAESKLPAFGTLPSVRAGNEKAMVGTAELTGYSVETFIPGVQRLLQMLATVKGLSEPRMQSGSLAEIGTRAVTNFEGNAFVDARVMSGRYAQGLPPEDDIEIPSIGVTGSAAPAGAAPAGAPK